VRVGRQPYVCIIAGSCWSNRVVSESRVGPVSVPDAHAAISRYQALIRVSEALRSYDDPDALFKSLARELEPVARFDFLGLALYDERTRIVVPRVLEANGKTSLLPELTSDDQITYWVLEQRQPLVIAAVDEERRFAQEVEYLGRQKARSVCCLPLMTPQRKIGMLIAASRAPYAYSADDVTFLSLVANQVAFAVDHTQRAVDARLRATALERRVTDLAAENDALSGHRRVVGQSVEWRTVLKQATQVAATETTVLIHGESGTGKEVVARFIHRASARGSGPFVALNCAALPEQLLESELFGYERGAFTGAVQAKPGQLELAAGGVLFLDEVGEMSASAQAKVLRVIQEREFQRVGGTRTLRADVRLVAATNRNLRAQIERGAFREDLYYRLNVFEIRLPALRERRDDILPLAEVFLGDVARSIGRPPGGIAREARDALLGYGWPGNVRELRNVLERAAILCEGGLITSEHLALDPPPLRQSRSVAASSSAQPETSTDLKTIERSTIERALVEAKHNKSLAAKKLGLTRKQLYVRLRQHGLL
jgi:transcriptional regulator with GAF, ATPase, and Fis domain